MSAAVIALVIATALGARPAPAAEPIGWEEADKHVGEEATVEGRVMGIHCSPLSCLLAFDPSFNRFTAVVQAEHFDVFPPDQLDRLYSGRRVLVRGRIRKIDNQPEIEVQKPDDLRVVTAKTRAEREAAHAEQVEAQAEAQAEITDRLGEVLARMDELAERLAAMQERMELMFAQLEQRTAALAAAQPEPPVPFVPTYGEPQPRPGYETLRSLKRGMSRADVQRLAGQPLQVETTASGAETWYYGYGRSISFDARGRAQGLSGFPKP